MKLQETKKFCKNLKRTGNDRGEARLIPKMNYLCQLSFKANKNRCWKFPTLSYLLKFCSWWCWSSRPEVFCEKSVLNNFAIIKWKHLCWSLFLIKLHAFRPIAFFWILQILKNIYFEEYLRTAVFVYCRTFNLAKIIQKISCCWSSFQFFWYFVQTWRESMNMIKRKRFHIWIKGFFVSRHKLFINVELFLSSRI